MGRVSGLVGIDVDGPEGERLLQDASGEERTPGTLAFKTARGLRLLYALDPDTTVRSWSIHQEGSELKVLGEGSLTVMPPSRHATGLTYRWIRRRGHGTLAVALEWVFRKLQDARDATLPGRKELAPKKSAGRSLRGDGMRRCSESPVP